MRKAKQDCGQCLQTSRWASVDGKSHKTPNVEGRCQGYGKVSEHLYMGRILQPNGTSITAWEGKTEIEPISNNLSW